MLHLDTNAVNSVIADNQNLSVFWKWILEHSTSLTLPYHNMRHTMEMMQIMLDMYYKMHMSPEQYGDEILNEDDLYILMVSAMFHDFSHSGGIHTDKENVETAIAGMETCLRTFLMPSSDTDRIIDECARVIRATQYPYVIPDEQLSKRQRVIRECDILVVFFDDVIIQTVTGLKTEMRKPEWGKFIASYLEFIKDSAQTFRLKYSIDTVEKYGGELMKMMEMFLKVLK